MSHPDLGVPPTSAISGLVAAHPAHDGDRFDEALREFDGGGPTPAVRRYCVEAIRGLASRAASIGRIDDPFGFDERYAALVRLAQRVAARPDNRARILAALAYDVALRGDLAYAGRPVEEELRIRDDARLLLLALEQETGEILVGRNGLPSPLPVAERR